MKLLHEVTGMYELPDGRVFVENWGNGLLIEAKDWGGVEELPKEVGTATIGPWVGLNGDEKYRLFVHPVNRLVANSYAPSQSELLKAEILPAVELPVAA